MSASVRSLVVAACAALALPASAPAADLVFSEVQTVSPAGVVADAPDVAVDPAGNTVGAWREARGGKTIVYAAYRTAGGFFGTAVPLSPTGQDASAPAVAIARDGTAIVAWRQPQPGAPAGRQDVVAAVRPPGGSFGTPAVVSTGSDSATAFEVEFDGAGNAIVMFTTDLGNGGVGKQRAELAFRPAGGAFGAPSPVFLTTGDPNANQDGYVGGYDIAFDPGNNALIAFEEACCQFNQDQGTNQLWAFGRTAGGTIELQDPAGNGWVSRRNTDRSVGRPLAVISGTRQLVGYSRSVGAGTCTSEWVRRAANGATWSGFRTFAGSRTDPTKCAGTGSMSSDAAGNAVATAHEGNTSTPVSREAFAPAASELFTEPATPLPAALVGSDALLQDDGNGRMVAVVTPAGSSTRRLRYATRSPGPTPVYGSPQEVPGFEVTEVRHAMGPDGDVAALGLRQEGLDVKVVAVFGSEPAPPPPPVPGDPTPPPPADPPAPPPPPPAPVANAIDAVGKVESGRPVVLSVAITGVVTRIEWRVGNSEPYVGDAVERAIRFRPGTSTTVKATLIGPGGTKVVSRTIAGPRAPDDADARRVAAGAPSRTVVATGRPDNLSGKLRSCAQTTIYSGGRTLFGCFAPLDELTDIPAAERGVLDPLASAYRLTRSDAPLMDRAVQLTDGYLSGGGTVTLDGRWPVTPAGGARLVAYPQAQALTSSNASVRVAGQPVKPSGGGFNLPLPSGGTDIDLGAVPRPAGLRDIGGFPYTGTFTVVLGRARATIETNLRFPGFVTRSGVAVQPRVRLFADQDRLFPDSIPAIGPAGVDFGPIPVRNFKVAYDAATNEWAGGGVACVFETNCLSFEAPAGALRFGGGELTLARTSLDFGDPGQPLAPGVFLERASMGFGLNPARIFGGARIGVGSFVKLDGREVFAFPSAAAPYQLRRDEVGDAFPAGLYAQRFTRPLIAAGADVLIALPILGETRLGGGYLLYETPGYVAFGGNAGFDVLGIVRFGGGINGEYDLLTQRSNLHGDIRACLIAVDDDLCASSVAHVSRGRGVEGGAGACLTVGPVSVGGGVLWAAPGKPIVWPLDGCKWSPFRVDVRGRAAQAATSFTMEVRAGQPSPALQLNGTGAAPRVKITGPGGQTLQSGTEGLAYTADGKVRLVHVDTADAHYTVVGLQDAAPGTWRVEPLPDSAPITSTARATDPPDAKVSGTVTGRDATRVLRYDVAQRPAQRVTFYDVSSSGARKAIGTATSGRGRITFTPAPGGGAHTILAAFELNGSAAEERTVTRFTPPPIALPAPRALKVKRSGTRLAISWAGVRGATSYELAVTTTSGRQIFRTVKTRRTTVPGIAKTTGGTVTVRAAATLREGRAARRTFRATATTRRKLTSLRRCTVKGKKVSCRS